MQMEHIELIHLTHKNPRDSRRALRGPQEIDSLRAGVAEQEPHPAFSIVGSNQRDFVTAEREVRAEAADHMAERVKFLNEIARARSVDADEALFSEECREGVEGAHIALIFSAPVPKQHAPLTGCERL